MKQLIDHLSERLNERIINHQAISGGDISQAFSLETLHNRYFLKVNSRKHGKALFKAELLGLKAIAATNTIAVPKVFDHGSFGDYGFLLMEFIVAKSPDGDDYKRLAVQLAKLHKQTSVQFGFEHDNFIGSLPQRNKPHTNWTDFYLEERLLPQFELALSKNLLITAEIPKVEKMKQVLSELFLGVNPSLLHGDLWSGNFLIAENGMPYLIDPAVYYGHHEVDIAMTMLFGGFSSSFYTAYHHEFPVGQNFNARIAIYQLYYLLVHLNLFGSSYYNAVKRITLKYLA